MARPPLVVGFDLDMTLADLTEFPAWLANRLGVPRAVVEAWSQPGGAPN